MADDFFLDMMDDESDFLEKLDSMDADLDLDSWLNDLNLESENDVGAGYDSFDIPVSTPAKQPVKKGVPAPAKKNTAAPARKAPAPAKPPKPRKEPKPEPPVEPDPFLDGVSRHHSIINVLLVIVAVALLAGIGGLLYLQKNIDPYDGRIVPNVYVAGVNVGGLTEEEAASVLNNAASVYTSNNMIVTLGKQQIALSPADTHAYLNTAAAVKAAFDYGRTGTAAERQEAYRSAQESPVYIDLSSNLNLDTTYIRSLLMEAANKMRGTFTPSGYKLEGERPALDADSYDASVPCQTLVLSLGSPGSNTDIDGLYNAVMEAYSQCNFRFEADSKYLPDLPEDLDLNAIKNEISIEPVEAREDPTTKEVTVGSCGYTFDIEEAQEKLKNASYGETVSVSMKYVKPNVLDIRGDFPEVLSSYSTALSQNANYNKNLAVICKAIDGTVIPAGGSFSFNETVPKCTADNGFLSAPTHGDYCLTEVMGGGVDQVATTLYVSAICSNLDIVQKSNGDHVCSYTIRGTEVAVGQSWQDLKIRNAGSTDVIIRAKVTDTQVIVRILGKEPLKSIYKVESEDSYTAQPGTAFVEKAAGEGFNEGQVLIEGIGGGSMRLFKVEYDKETNKEIGRTNVGYVELPSVSKTMVRIVNR